MSPQRAGTPSTESRTELASILIVEDDRIIARDLELTLGELGYQVTDVVASGEKAIETVQTREPDLVLMDIHLEGEMDGVETAETIQRRFDVPIIYCTAYADSITRQRAKITEPFGYIVKPYQEKELQSTIDVALYKHQADRQVREQERWLSAILRSIDQGVIATDPFRRVSFINLEAERLLGCKQRSCQGLEVEEVCTLVSAENGAKVENPVQQALSLKRITTSEEPVLLVTSEGKRVPIVDSAAPIVDENGSLSGAVLVLRDITESLRMEEALQVSEERFRLLFERDVVGNLICHPDGSLITCNQSFARMLCFDSVSEAAQINLFDHFQDKEERPRLINLLRQEEKVEYYELALTRNNGKSVHVVANLVGELDPQGELIQINGHLIDITNQKRLEEQLRQAHKLEAIGRLTGGIAHDFNNLLMAILGYTDLLLKQLQNSDYATDLQQIKNAANRASSLTRQLLAYSRRQVLQPRVINLNSIVSELKEMLSRLLGENVDLILDLEPDLPDIKADQSQLEQIVLNLAINARDAMAGSGVLTLKTLTVNIHESYDHEGIRIPQGQYVCLAVADTGVGMEASIVERIFDPYFTTKEVGKGTGLGLATVYGIIKQSEGHIQVDTELGRGSTFRLFFPPPVQRMTVEESFPLPEAETRKTIFLVESDDGWRNMVSTVLEENNYHVLKAENASQAMEKVENYIGSIHLLITELRLPGTRGTELADRIRELQPGLKVLYVSQLPPEKSEEHLLASHSYLQKPLQAGILTNRVREILKTHD